MEPTMIRVNFGYDVAKASQTAPGFWVLQAYTNPDPQSPPDRYRYWKGDDPAAAMAAAIRVLQDPRYLSDDPLRSDDV